MKTALAIFGGVVFTLSVLGAVGVGHFYLYYGKELPRCTAPQPSISSPPLTS